MTMFTPRILPTRVLPTLGLAAAIALALGTPAAHAGFFEQLFGMQPAPEVPSYDYGQQPMDVAPAYRPKPKKHVAIVDKRAGRQKVTDLMHDDTLRPGDAVMMKDGIHVFAGPEASHHGSGDFVALDESDDLNRREKAALVAMDTTRNDPLRGAVAPDTIASGRSAAVGTPVTSGFKITDARGKSLRYVGP